MANPREIASWWLLLAGERTDWVLKVLVYSLVIHAINILGFGSTEIEMTPKANGFWTCWLELFLKLSLCFDFELLWMGKEMTEPARKLNSLSFLIRFCTAAISYLMCKFPSFSRDDLCALVPPSLVKKVKGINVLLLFLRKISLSSTSHCRPSWNYNLYKESYIKMSLGTLLPYHLVYLLVWQLHTNRGCNFF